MKFSWKIFENWLFWKMSFFLVGHFEFFFRKKKFFLLHSHENQPKLYGRMDGSKFWCFPWFPENSLLCVILCYTVYVSCLWNFKDGGSCNSKVLPKNQHAQRKLSKLYFQSQFSMSKINGIFWKKKKIIWVCWFLTYCILGPTIFEIPQPNWYHYTPTRGTCQAMTG